MSDVFSEQGLPEILRHNDALRSYRLKRETTARIPVPVRRASAVIIEFARVSVLPVLTSFLTVDTGTIIGSSYVSGSTTPY